MRLPRAGGYYRTIEHIKKSAHAEYGGLPSNMRRVMAKIHVCFFYFVCFCTYSWPYPSYLASPVLVNPSKVIFLIINYIQNIYCIAICPENIISRNLYITLHPPHPPETPQQIQRKSALRRIQTARFFVEFVAISR